MNYRSTRINAATLRPYAVLRSQSVGPQGPDVETRCNHIARLLIENDSYAQRVHVAVLPDETCGIMGLMAYPFTGPPWQAIIDWSSNIDHGPDILACGSELIQNWLKDLGELPESPVSLSLRLNLDRAFDGLESIFRETGWQRGKERYEFKTSVDALSTQWQGPLDWKNLDQVGMELAARIMEDAGNGPDWGVDDNGRDLIESYLGDSELTCDPSCVEVGFLQDGQAVAFIVAQTAPADGWCTITFMGVVPELRGQGFGQWVHRRGFELMRRQGGKLYHGGTSADNVSMRRLFEKHGCQPYAHLVEWQYRF